MKQCAFCAEEIQDIAIKCRYCGEWFRDVAHPCRNCKTWIRKSDMECPFCGYGYSFKSELLMPQKESRLKQALEELERSMIIDAMENTHYHQTNAANTLGISERMLRYKLSKYSISTTAINSSQPSTQQVFVSDDTDKSDFIKMLERDDQ